MLKLHFSPFLRVRASLFWLFLTPLGQFGDPPPPPRPPRSKNPCCAPGPMSWNQKDYVKNFSPPHLLRPSAPLLTARHNPAEDDRLHLTDPHTFCSSSPGAEELSKSGSTLGGGGSGGSLAGSLESLVGAFDEKVNRVLKDLDTDTQHMAPVQVRTQDEIMSESQ